jgi:hypothetical protein
MKNFKVYLLLLCFFVIGCKPFLDVKPTDGLLDEIALITNSDFEATLNGTYTALLTGIYGTGTTSTASRSYYGSRFFQVAEYPTDNVKRASSNSGLGQFLFNINFTTDDGDIEELFHAIYIVIFRANVILSKLENSKLTQAQKNRFKGEALMLRALAHHDLVRLFAKHYGATAGATHEGIPIKTDPAIVNVARNSVAEVYSQILKDIDEALPLLSATLNTLYFNRVSANALKVRVLCYKEDWAAAEALASQVINSAPALATGTSYTNMWRTPETNGEVIFKIKVILGQASMGTSFSNISTDIHQFWASGDIASLYDPSDIRRTSFISENAGNFIINKYPGTTTNPGLVDIKLLRTSEMYLIRAEARYKQNKEVDALSDVNAVKTARGISTVNVSGVSLFQEIKNERRKEFAFEGHRWFDLQRYQEPLVRIDCNSATCNLPVGSHRFVMPIPQQEIFTNPLMTQTSGY